MRSCSGSRLFMRSLVATASEYVRFIVCTYSWPEVPTTVVATASAAELAVAMRIFYYVFAHAHELSDSRGLATYVCVAGGNINKAGTYIHTRKTA